MLFLRMIVLKQLVLSHAITKTSSRENTFKMNLLPTDGYLVPTKWSFKAGNQIRPVPIFIDMLRVIRMSLCIKVFHYIPAQW